MLSQVLCLTASASQDALLGEWVREFVGGSRRKHGGFGSFNYAPGQYAQLRIRQLSRIEWHPFTISSAPCDDFIMFHIAAQGEAHLPSLMCSSTVLVIS